MLSVVGGTVPVVTSGVVCGSACVSIAASNTSGCMPRTCGTRLGPGSPAAMYVCMYTYSTDAHACVRVCPRFLRPLTVVDEIREAPGRYVLTPCHSLSLAHPRCVCTAMVANQHTLMHVDGEDSTNQPTHTVASPEPHQGPHHAAHNVARHVWLGFLLAPATVPSFLTHSPNKREVVQRFPHLLEQRTATRPYGCRCVRVCCVAPITAPSSHTTTAHGSSVGTTPSVWPMMRSTHVLKVKFWDRRSAWPYALTLRI